MVIVLKNESNGVKSAQVTTDTTNFDNILSPTDTDVQKALDTLDTGSFNTTQHKTDYVSDGTEPVGTRFWNDTKGTTSLKTSDNTTLDDGLETRYYGKASGDILNGQLVQFAQQQGDHILFKVAVASEVIENPMLIMGLATEDISNGSFGNIAKFGEVTGNTTGRSLNDLLYFDNITGQLTNIEPQAPERRILIAVVQKEENNPSAANGILLVRISRGSKLNELEDVDGTPLTTNGQILVRDQDRGVHDFTENVNNFVRRSEGPELTQEPSGFKDNGLVDIDYDMVARTITLTGTVTAYREGKHISALTDGWVSDPHPDTNGLWFLYYNGTDFVWSQTPWTFEQVQIAFVAYTPTLKFGIRECHGLMSWQTHQEFHETIGTYRELGGDLGNYVLDSTTAANRRPTVSECVVKDEDIPTTNASWTDSTYTHFHLDTNGDAYFDYTQSDIVELSGNRPYYNLYNGSTRTQTLMSNNYYMTLWLIAMPTTSDIDSQRLRFFWVQGQNQSNDLGTQQALTVNDLNLGGLGNLSPEFVFIEKTIIRYQSGNRRLVQTEKLTGNRYSQSSVSGGYLTSVTSDDTLSGSGTASSPLVVNPAFVDHNLLLNTHNLTTDIDHNTITGLQGGTTNEYYHLTQQQALDVDLNTADRHLADRIYNTEDGEVFSFSTGTASTNGSGASNIGQSFTLNEDSILSKFVFATSNTNTFDISVRIYEGQVTSGTPIYEDLSFNWVESVGTTEYELTTPLSVVAGQYTIALTNNNPPTQPPFIFPTLSKTNNPYVGGQAFTNSSFFDFDFTIDIYVIGQVVGNQLIIDEDKVYTDIDLEIGGDITGNNLSGTNTGDQSSNDFDHNSLSGVQGLTNNEAYHITYQQTLDIASNTQNNHLPDRIVADFIGGLLFENTGTITQGIGNTNLGQSFTIAEETVLSSIIMRGMSVTGATANATIYVGETNTGVSLGTSDTVSLSYDVDCEFTFDNITLAAGQYSIIANQVSGSMVLGRSSEAYAGGNLWAGFFWDTTKDFYFKIYGTLSSDINSAVITSTTLVTGGGISAESLVTTGTIQGGATTVNGTLTVVGDISQTGTTYETHAEQLYTTKDLIMTREGAVGGLGAGEYTGFQAEKYDGVNDGQLVFDAQGWARVGDVGALQKLATIEETSIDQGFAFYDDATLQLQTKSVADTQTQLNYWTKSGSDLNYTSGNIGIKTAATTSALSVGGDIILSSGTDEVIASIYRTYSGNINMHASGNFFRVSGVGGDTDYKLTVNGLTGNTGIGNDNPLYALEVLSSESSNFACSVSHSLSGSHTIYMTYNNGSVTNGLGVYGGKGTANDNDLFVDGKFYVKGNGNVGIKNPAPQYDLSVFGELQISDTTNTGGGFIVKPYKTGHLYNEIFLPNLEDLRFTYDSGSVAMAIDEQTGNVGIATTNTIHPLTVQSDTSAFGISILGRSDSIGELNFWDVLGTTFQGRMQGSTNKLTFQSSASQYINFLVGGSEIVRVSTGGYLGIGTPTPAYKFVASNGGALGFEVDPTAASGGQVNVLAYDRIAASYKPLVFNASKFGFANGGVNMSSLPTSATGLSTGDIWNNSGVLNIV